jgi:8-oxo-dGTP pyrophosphatase MutT (NUDIX family)
LRGGIVELKPWSVSSTRAVLKDRWINVRADECVTAEGILISPYYVLSYPDWVHVIAIDIRGNLVLVEQYRHGIAACSLEVPGGGIDSDEDPIQAGQRELAEETGYGGGEWFSCGRLCPNPANQSNYSHIVLARGVSQVERPKDDPQERVKITTKPIAEAINSALTGEICQALHVSALLIALNAHGYCRISI